MVGVSILSLWFRKYAVPPFFKTKRFVETKAKSGRNKLRSFSNLSSSLSSSSLRVIITRWKKNPVLSCFENIELSFWSKVQNGIQIKLNEIRGNSIPRQTKWYSRRFLRQKIRSRALWLKAIWPTDNWPTDLWLKDILQTPFGRHVYNPPYGEQLIDLQVSLDTLCRLNVCRWNVFLPKDEEPKIDI